MKRTRLSPTSPKRAKAIADGTYTKPQPKAMKRTKFKSKRPLNFLTPAQFLTRLEHTLPTVKERTTEEKLAEAVCILQWYMDERHNAELCDGTIDLRILESKARAFLKSIKP